MILLFYAENIFLKCVNYYFICVWLFGFFSPLRQNKLEEALLFSGQFTDALQALIDWLYKIEPQLAEDQPVHGDIDLVMNLIDNHKVVPKMLFFNYWTASSILIISLSFTII